MTTITLRPVVPADWKVIEQVIRDSFRGQPYADGDEAEFMADLAGKGKVSYSQVGELDGKVVSYIAFTPVAAPVCKLPWLVLTMLVVDPQVQKQGIGRTLLQDAHAQLDNKVSGYVVVGHPEYYPRFGYAPCDEMCPPEQPTDAFFVRAVNAPPLNTPLTFLSEFSPSPG